MDWEWREIAVPTNFAKLLQMQSVCGKMKLPQAETLPERGSL